MCEAFEVSPRKLSNTNHCTLPVLMRMLPKPSRDNWLAYEEAIYRKYGLTVILAFIDVKTLRVASRNTLPQEQLSMLEVSVCGVSE